MSGTARFGVAWHGRLLVGAVVAVAGSILGSGAASANNFSVSTCVDGHASISVNVSQYWQHRPNHLVVHVAGATVADSVFEDAYQHTFQTVNGATWKVDLSTGQAGGEQHVSGVITCGPVATTTVPATSTTVPATTTTTPSTTTSPATTVPTVTVAPTVPSSTPQAHVAPRLPATGFPFGVATGIVVVLVLVGFVLVGFSVNKREVSELHGFGRRETER